MSNVKKIMDLKGEGWRELTSAMRRGWRGKQRERDPGRRRTPFFSLSSSRSLCCARKTMLWEKERKKWGRVWELNDTAHFGFCVVLCECPMGRNQIMFYLWKWNQIKCFYRIRIENQIVLKKFPHTQIMASY